MLKHFRHQYVCCIDQGLLAEIIHFGSTHVVEIISQFKAQTINDGSGHRIKSVRVGSGRVESRVKGSDPVPSLPCTRVNDVSRSTCHAPFAQNGNPEKLLVRFVCIRTEIHFHMM